MSDQIIGLLITTLAFLWLIVAIIHEARKPHIDHQEQDVF